MSAPKIAHEGHPLDFSGLEKFRIDDTRLVLQVGSTMVPDEFGVATLRRRWWARKDRIASFIAQRGDIDREYRDLRLIASGSITYDGASAWMEETYNGIIGGAQAPTIIQRKTWPRREVTLHNSSGSLVLVYRCPKRHRRWAALTETQEDETPVVAPEFKPAPDPLFFKDVRGQTITGNGATAELLATFDFRIENKRFLEVNEDGFVYRHDEIIERQIVQISPADVNIIRALNQTALL